MLIFIPLQSCSFGQCRIEDLLIDSSLFPSGTVVSDSAPIEDLSRDSQIRTFIMPPNIEVRHLVSLHTAPWSTRLVFNEKKETFFSSNNYWGPWLFPAEIAPRSSVANQFHAACSELNQDGNTLYYCRAIARYGSHFSYLTQVATKGS
jgi:hypothetical protein